MNPSLNKMEEKDVEDVSPEKQRILIIAGDNYSQSECAIALAEVKKLFEIKDDEEIIIVEGVEDIPLEDRFRSDAEVIRQFYNLGEPELLPPIFYPEEKRKGHERPYKYHR